MNSEKKQKKTAYYFDYTLLIVVVFLIAFGMIMIYSTSSYSAAIEYDDPSYFFKKQLFAVFLGSIIMLVTIFVPYTFWKHFYIVGYVLSIILIFLVLVPSIGYESHGARRWIKLFGISLQPAEVVKLCIILVMAVLIVKMGNKINTSKGSFILVGIAGFMSLLLFVVTKNMSSSIIVMGITLGMMFVASKNYKWYILGILVFSCIAAIYVFVLISGSKNTDGALAATGGFRSSRVLAWLDPEAYSSGYGLQILQSLYAIGSGGLLGKGLGQSMQKLGDLPEAQNDMIFSILCEELGIIGGIAILILFIILIWRLVIIAQNASDLFGSMLVVGIMCHFILQILINIAVVTNTIPNTGVTLPFISYGGSSSLFLMIEIGIAISVSRGIRIIEAKDVNE